jgi:hypothetical protein
MGWRIKVTAVVMVGAAVGGTALYLKDYKVTSVGPAESTPYTESAAFKLDSGQPVQVRVSRCDLGVSSRQLILKVYGELTNLGQTEIPRRQFSFPLLDARGQFHRDHAAAQSADANAFSLRPGEKREFVTRYLLEPAALQDSLDLAFMQEMQTNKLVQVKSAAALDANLTEGQWRTFREARWKL